MEVRKVKSKFTIETKLTFDFKISMGLVLEKKILKQEKPIFSNE